MFEFDNLGFWFFHQKKKKYLSLRSRIRIMTSFLEEKKKDKNVKFVFNYTRI